MLLKDTKKFFEIGFWIWKVLKLYLTKLLKSLFYGSFSRLFFIQFDFKKIKTDKKTQETTLNSSILYFINLEFK